MTTETRRIVCIEDDRETAGLIAEELTDRGGFEIILTYDGQEGLAAILREQPDLVLSDISMPALSGFEVLEKLSALADRDNELRGRQLGADDYVLKPVDFDILESIIRTRLGRSVRQEYWPADINLHDREIETLTWAARGKTSAEIAIILGVAKRTVDFHIDSAREKLGVATRIEAAVKAARTRLIKP